ncbi:MAG: UbiA family prenyltransferase [Fibrobacterota bacterium]
MKTLVTRFFDALFITRPILLIPVWGYFLLGYYRASLAFHPSALVPFPVLGRDFPMLLTLPHEAAIALFMLSLSVAATYILNQIADLHTDKENSGLPLLAKAGVPLALAHAENIVLTLVPLVYAFAMGGTLRIFFLAAFGLNLVYNLRPFYFTGRPYLDFLTNALGFGVVAFGIGWLSANGGTLGGTTAFFRAAAPYALLMVAGSINSTLPDVEGDRRTGKVTTLVYLGWKRANVLSTIAVALAFLLAAMNRDGIAGITALVSLPLFIKYHFSGKIEDGTRTFQTGGGFLMLMTVPVFPWFFFYGLLTYLATRIYFRVRHNTDYPSPGIAKE